MNQDLDNQYFEARHKGTWKAIEIKGKLYHGYEHNFLFYTIDNGQLRVYDLIVLEKNRIKEEME